MPRRFRYRPTPCPGSATHHELAQLDGSADRARPSNRRWVGEHGRLHVRTHQQQGSGIILGDYEWRDVHTIFISVTVMK
jgi:hypothetical protein